VIRVAALLPYIPTGHTIVRGQLQEYVLALQEIQGRHIGENLAPIVLAILQDYSITYKLGYIQMDNATNNDTLIAALSSGMLLPYYYATPLLLCYSLTIIILIILLSTSL
jgi:hypothetical protein